MRAIQQAEARKAEAEALRFAMEQEAAGIRAKGLAEAEAIEKKAEAQRKMGEASVLEMYLNALPDVVKNAAIPLAQTDKIVMYGDGNSTRLIKDVMSSASQVMDGMKESTGIDLQALLAGNGRRSACSCALCAGSRSHACAGSLSHACAGCPERYAGNSGSSNEIRAGR